MVVGGESDRASKYIAPTVLDDVALDSPLMTDEIFGPLLPLVPYDNVSDAIAFINARDKPLALYVFATKKETSERLPAETSSGATVINDCLMHAGIESLPFGGVGPSGMGAYHGKHTFDTFTHRKAVLKKDLGMEAVNSLRYPPYSDRQLSIVQWAAGKTETRWYLSRASIAALFTGAVAFAAKLWGLSFLAAKLYFQKAVAAL